MFFTKSDEMLRILKYTLFKQHLISIKRNRKKKTGERGIKPGVVLLDGAFNFSPNLRLTVLIEVVLIKACNLFIHRT